MMNQDTEKVFRNLVNNIYMPNFDYLETKFAFRTVFHKDLYSYCMCRCGYEHELFDYIAPTTGEINQEKFEHVLKCILEGKCPHITSQIPEEYVKASFCACTARFVTNLFGNHIVGFPTRRLKYPPYVLNSLIEVTVHGLHVAAAVGTIQAIENMQLREDDDCDRIKGFYWLDPCLVAVLKNSKAACHPKIWNFIGGWDFFSNVELTFYMTVGKKLDEIGNGVTSMTFRVVSILIFLVEQRNVPLLKLYMDKQTFDGYFQEALQVAFNLKFDDVINTLLNYSDWISTITIFGGESEDDKQCIEDIELHSINSIINSDQPKFIDQILQKLLEQIKTNYFGNKPIVCELFRRLSTICDALQLPEMKKIVLKYNHTFTRFDGLSDIPTPSKSDQANVLFNMLFERCMMGKSKIVSCLKQMNIGISNLSAMINNKKIVDKIDCSALFDNLDSLKAILNFGWDVNSVDNEGQTFFSNLLERMSETPYPVYREVLELVIFHNPDISKHISAISYALKADLRLYKLTMTVKEFEATNDQLVTCDEKEQYKAFGGALDNKMQNMGYVMDAKLHGRFGHDNENSCFNFLVPFLIVCGFHVSMEDHAVLDSLTGGSLHQEEPKLHSEEVNFIKQYLESPQSLKQECLNTLRRHYVGSQIHQFVELETMPREMKDYILLKPMMKGLRSELI